MKILSKSVAETEKIAQVFLNKIKDLKSERAMVVGLFGDLGSGKTTFTQALGKILNIREIMTSPTFVIEKIYPLDGKCGFKKLIHIDAYRLDSGKELQSLNFKEISEDPNNLILIEWPERVEDVLMANLIKVNFKFISEFEREIELDL
jgi:tRNA threonylcarbamoyladenosine biosynthesis protein TsaE